MITSLLISCAVFICVCGDPSVPAPRPEDYWLVRHEGFVNNTASNPSIPVLFFGDSITDSWNWEGRPTWDEYIAPHGAVNYGISGDRVEHVHWRILNGEIQGLDPKLVVIKIGTNNHEDNAGAIANGIGSIINTLQLQLPDAKVLLLSVLPRTGEAEFLKIATINIYLSKFHNGVNLHYLNLFDHFGSDWGTDVYLKSTFPDVPPHLPDLEDTESSPTSPGSLNTPLGNFPPKRLSADVTQPRGQGFLDPESQAKLISANSDMSRTILHCRKTAGSGDDALCRSQEKSNPF